MKLRHPLFFGFEAPRQRARQARAEVVLQHFQSGSRGLILRLSSPSRGSVFRKPGWTVAGAHRIAPFAFLHLCSSQGKEAGSMNLLQKRHKPIIFPALRGQAACGSQAMCNTGQSGVRFSMPYCPVLFSSIRFNSQKA